jgi:hypothetical protein
MVMTKRGDSKPVDVISDVTREGKRWIKNLYQPTTSRKTVEKILKVIGFPKELADFEKLSITVEIED